MQMAIMIKHNQERRRGDKKISNTPSFFSSLPTEFKHIIKWCEKKSKEIGLVVANEDPKQTRSKEKRWFFL